jgi:hypothetical protein
VKYASFLLISRALHLNIFYQPVKKTFFLQPVRELVTGMATCRFIYFLRTKIQKIKQRPFCFKTQYIEVYLKLHTFCSIFCFTSQRFFGKFLENKKHRGHRENYLFPGKKIMGLPRRDFS